MLCLDEKILFGTSVIMRDKEKEENIEDGVVLCCLIVKKKKLSRREMGETKKIVHNI